MRKIYIHIGLPKTGSTAIQRAFSKQRAQLLAEEGICYPGPMFFQGVLLGKFHPNGFDHPMFARLGFSKAKGQAVLTRTLRDIEDRIADPDCDFVVSAEQYFRLSSDSFAQMRDYFQGLGLDPYLICYLRHPVSLQTSLIQQNVKVRGARLAELMEHLVEPEIRDTLERVGAVFPADRLLICSHEDTRKIGAQNHFLRLIRPDTKLELPDMAVNSSLSLAAVLALDIASAIYPDPADGKNLKSWARSLPGPNFDVSPDYAALLRANSAPEMVWIEKQYGITFRPPKQKLADWKLTWAYRLHQFALKLVEASQYFSKRARSEKMQATQSP
ncbi:MAG: hypothetical protein ACPGNV_01310 [Mangrovicoccus sp.]